MPMDLKDREAQKTKWSGVKVGREFNMRAFHHDMQERRDNGEDISFKAFLKEVYGDEMTPEQFYRDAQLGDVASWTLQKMITTDGLPRWLVPEIMRDAIRRGLEYSPIYRTLITGNESINGTGVTMPTMDFRDADPNDVRLRDTNEGATITEAQIIEWSEKNVTVGKKARGLLQSYESIQFTPMNLSAVYFEEVGTRLGADLDAEFINILINGDQEDGSEAAFVIGATAANTLAYKDLARTWLRFRRLNRISQAMIVNESDALDIMLMEEFQRTRVANGEVNNAGGTTLNFQTPLPTSQNIFIHHAVPAKTIVLVDPARAVVQLTALPLLIESEQIVRRQLRGEFASITTGFANVFRDGRLVLDWSTTIGANPGPTIPV